MSLCLIFSPFFDFSPYFIEIALFPPKGYVLDTLSVFVSPEM
jgi:hypothetical protein